MSSLASEEEEVTCAVQWLISQNVKQITHAITESVNLLQRAESGMGYRGWHVFFGSLRLQILPLICCLDHAGARRNEQADRRQSMVDIMDILLLDRADVLKSLRNFVNINRPEHFSTDCLKERGVENASGCCSAFQSQGQPEFS